MKSNRDNCGKVDPFKNVSYKSHKGNGTAHLLKNKHAEVVFWLRAECFGVADANPWSVEMGEPKTVPPLNSVRMS